MTEIWRLTGVLRSGVLLVAPDYEIAILGSPDSTGRSTSSEPIEIVSITFSEPEAVDNAVWPYWNCVLSHVWDYKVIIQFRANDEQDYLHAAWRKLESIASRLSFLSSAPVIVQHRGNITNAPKEPVPGVQYTTVRRAAEMGSWDEQPLRIALEDIDFLSAFLLRNELQPEGSERVERSMRWLQHSYVSNTPVDEFLCLMLAFEAISHLLKPPDQLYWRCNSCRTLYKACPECGASTARQGTGVPGMRSFVCEKLNWSHAKWNTVWGLRCALVHGDRDLSPTAQSAVVAHLQDLEIAVINALRYVLRLSTKVPPHSSRRRMLFADAYLTLQWHMGEDEGASTE